MTNRVVYVNYSSQKWNPEEVRDSGPWGGNSHTCWARAVPAWCAGRFQQASHVWQAESKACFVTRACGTTCLCVLGSQWAWLCDKEIDVDNISPGLDQWKPGDPLPAWWSLSFPLSSDMKQDISGLLRLSVRWRGLSVGGCPSIQMSALGLASSGGSAKGSYTVNKAVGIRWVSLARHRSGHFLIVLQVPGGPGNLCSRIFKKRLVAFEDLEWICGKASS